MIGYTAAYMMNNKGEVSMQSIKLLNINDNFMAVPSWVCSPEMIGFTAAYLVNN